MYPAAVAARAPERPAVVMARTGDHVGYAEFVQRINQISHLFRERGLRPGDSLALMAENHPRYLELTWAAQLSGLRYTAVNSHLGADEAAYIVNDCGARFLVVSQALHEVAARLATPDVETRVMLDGPLPGWEALESATLGLPTSPIPDACEGAPMLYSSGTTGRPKGVQRPLPLCPPGEATDGVVPFLELLDLHDGDVYLCPAPLYHAAPLLWSMASQRLGASVVVMERFDPGHALELIERYAVTHAQFVPTHFVRMLKLHKAERGRYDLSSLRAVVHAAAPCPVVVKQEMLEWWGPIIHEYYSATEGHGATYITPEEWLRHPGSVGRPVLGEIHVTDDEGNESCAGSPGTIWFSGGYEFEYHGDPAKTDEARNNRGWATVGDVGYVDAEGYLYLTDRQSFMIISGGVNVYPQEIEDVLITHPKVFDVAVVGVPDPDLGEQVKAVVQPMTWSDAGEDLSEELLAFCREHLASYKCPRTLDFDPSLPRLDTGKLYKRAVRARYL